MPTRLNSSFLDSLKQILTEYQQTLQLNTSSQTSSAEKTDLVKMQNLLKTAAKSSISRENFVPGHFTASAFITNPSFDKLALIFHGKLHRWLQPGGHIDEADSSPMAACLREAQEEIFNISLTTVSKTLFDIDIHTIPESKKRGEPAHDHFDLRFLFASGDQKLTAASDAKDAKWVSFTDIQESENSDQSVRRAIEKIIQLKIKKEGHPHDKTK